MTKISQNLRNLRQAKGVSQTEVAKQIKAQRGTYSAWERGLAEPSICFLIKIAKYHGVSVDELVGSKLKTKIVKEEG